MNTDLSDLTIIYVLDPPGLVLDSIILLSSIRKYLGPDVKVIGYTPSEKEDYLQPYVREFHEFMGAEIRLMEPFQGFVSPYKQGNKINACIQPRDAAYTLFLDTDTVIIEPFSVSDLFCDGAVSVVPEGVQGWGGNAGSWEYVYEKFGLPFPEDRVRLVRSHKLVPPYFNAGVIAFPTHSSFAQMWAETSVELDHDPKVDYKRPWLDQIALPLAIVRAGLNHNVLGQEWNFSISHPKHDHHMPAFFERVNSSSPKIIHHHQPKFFRGTKFQSMVDDALVESTIYDTLDKLLERQDQGQNRRREVWNRFGVLKAKQDRTPEESLELRHLGQEKHFIKSGATSIERQNAAAPPTILRSSSPL